MRRGLTLLLLVARPYLPVLMAEGLIVSSAAPEVQLDGLVRHIRRRGYRRADRCVHTKPSRCREGLCRLPRPAGLYPTAVVPTAEAGVEGGSEGRGSKDRIALSQSGKLLCEKAVFVKRIIVAPAADIRSFELSSSIFRVVPVSTTVFSTFPGSTPTGLIPATGAQHLFSRQPSLAYPA